VKAGRVVRREKVHAAAAAAAVSAASRDATRRGGPRVGCRREYGVGGSENGAPGRLGRRFGTSAVTRQAKILRILAACWPAVRRWTKFFINSYFYFSFFIHPLSSSLKLIGVKWKEKIRVCSVLFFCKVSLLVILLAKLFKLSIENIN
jgi:hypothetical protein